MKAKTVNDLAQQELQNNLKTLQLQHDNLAKTAILSSSEKAQLVDLEKKLQDTETKLAEAEAQRKKVSPPSLPSSLPSLLPSLLASFLPSFLLSLL